MPIDKKQAKGSTKRSSPTSGGANPRLTPVIGTVKDNADSTRSGRIWVYLNDNSGLDPEDRDNWRPVSFLSPFFGKTRNSSPTTGEGNYKGNSHSYGMWFSPPDIGTEVLCIFVNGDMNYGFYIGCIPDPEALHMVPAIGSATDVVPGEGESKKYGGSLRLPVTNINNNNKEITNTGKYLTEAKPIHRYTAATMWQQGILRDPIRGPISSSAQRENISRVGFGISTPGRPIYEGGFNDKTIADNLTNEKADQLKIVARRAGHSIVMDDGDVVGRDQLVRIRTADGHQILLSDDGQCIFIIHKNGQSYVELGKEGTVDVYSTNSINLRTQGDLNFHADNNVNIHAGKNLNIQGEVIHVNSEKEFKQRVGTDFSLSASGIYTAKAGGAMALESTGDISVASPAKAFINGSRVNLNSGKSGTKPKEVPAIDKIEHTDTLFDQQKGFLAAPNKLKSITSRAPAHAPWSNAGQGVNIKTNLNASSQLPSAPKPSVLATNTKAASTGVQTPVSQSTVAKAPTVNNSSKSVNPSVTKALTGQAATQAANQVPDAVKKGVAVVDSATKSPTLNVGQYAMTPQQLEKAGVIKPGSASLVNSLVATGANIATALPAQLFTGKPGAENLASFVSNLPAQSNALVKNLQVAQTDLQNAGVITGKETPSQIGGMIMSTAKNGLGDVVGAIKSATPYTDGGLAGALPGFTFNPLQSPGSLDSILSDIAQGNYASQLGENPGNALDGMVGSVDAAIKSPSLQNVLETSQGLTATAFNAIKQSMPDFEANKPVDLTTTVKQTAAQVLDASQQAVTNQATQKANGLTNGTVQNRMVQSNNVVGSQTNNPSVLSNNNILPAASSVASSLLGAMGKQTNNAANSIISGTVSNLTEPLDKIASATSTPKKLAINSTMTKNGLVDAANTLATGVISSTASSVASGLSNLPGGQGAVGSITNLAMGNTPILPNTKDLKATIDSASTDALNYVSNSFGGNAQNFINQASNLSFNTSNFVNGLTSLATKGLPAGASSILQSALGSLASQGSGIKIPNIGINTVDRSGIESGVAEALGDPGIPAPNYGGVDEASEGKIADLQKRRTAFINQQKDLSEKYNKANSAYYLSFGAYVLGSNNFPQGSPALQPLKAKYEQNLNERNQYKQQLDSLYKQYPEFARQNTSNTTKNSTTTVAGKPTGRTLSGSSTTGIG